MYIFIKTRVLGPRSYLVAPCSRKTRQHVLLHMETNHEFFFWNEPRKASISDKYATQHSCSPWMSIPVTVTLFAKFGPTLSKRVQESPASDEEKVPTWMILRSIQYVNCSRGLALSRRSVFPLEAVKAHFTLQKSSFVPVRYTGADLGAPHMLRNF